MPSRVAVGLPLRVISFPVVSKYPRHVPEIRMVAGDTAASILACRSPPASQFTLASADAAGPMTSPVATSARVRAPSEIRRASERDRSDVMSLPPEVVGGASLLNRSEQFHHSSGGLQGTSP